MTDFAHAGTVISGTHRTQDLIPALVGKLTELDAERAERITAHYPVTMADLEGDNFLAADALTDELFDALDDLAPEGWYFGAIEGDGADFGFWREPDYGDISEDQSPEEIARQVEQADSRITRCNGRWQNDA